MSARQHAAVMALFLCLVALFTYPLILDVGHFLPPHKDPFMYGWTMVSNTHRLVSVPMAVFHGNTFYPNGNSIAYTDLLLAPTLFPAGPVYLLTRNPVLQYNLTLLIWWALSGWAMYVAAFAWLRSHPGALLAALAFTLCPFRTDFYLEFQMQLAFPIPLAVLGLWRFLESRHWRYLIGVVALLWIEALASMYYAITLGLCLGVLAGLHALLRPRAWSGRLVGQFVAGGLLLGAILAPFLVPYFQNRRELGFERALRQLPGYSADMLTYFETGVTKLYHLSPTGHIAETSLFMGFVGLALALAAFVLPEGPGRPAPPPWQRIRRLLTVAMAGVTLALIITLEGRGWLRGLGFHVPNPERFLDAVLLLGVIRLGLEGWWATRGGEGQSPLGDRELRWISLFLVTLFFVLSLGPWIHYRRQELARGLYAHLYPYLLPLHAVRITTRIGVIVVFGISLLAGLGMKALATRLPGVRSRALATGSLALLLLAEYAPFPLPYRRVGWDDPPPVYRALAADPDDVAVLEWPQGLEEWDDYYTFMSIAHWKRITNGASGFLPPMSHDLYTALSEPDSPNHPFPSPEARTFLLGIHPLRYVVVHKPILDLDEQLKWGRLRRVPWARYVGTFGDDDLYRLTGEVVSAKVEKFFSWDYAHTRRQVVFRARPLGPVARARWLEIDLNGRPLGRRSLDDDWTSVAMPLGGPLSHSAPNVITIRWRYEAPEEPGGRWIGRTGVESPVDLSVVSEGKAAGDRASIRVDGVEVARNARGYNLVALDSHSGRLYWTEVFDTFASVEASHRLAEAVRRLPPGTVVVAAVKDEASRALTEDAIAALRTLGATQDLRGRYRTSYLLVGVAGAPSGTAIEQSGDLPLQVSIGIPAERIGVDIQDFDLK